MALKRKVEDLNTVEEAFRPLYTEKQEKGKAIFMLTEIEDWDAADKLRTVRTEAGALRIENNKYKGQLSAFEGVDVEVAANALVELQAAKDEIEALKAGKTDTKSIDKAVESRLTAVKTPLENQIKKLTTEKELLAKTNTELLQAQTSRTIEDAVVGAFTELKVNPSVYSGSADDPADGQLWARNRFHVQDGKVVDKVSGMAPKDLLEQMRDEGKRPYWFGETSGGGSGHLGNDTRPAANPWMQRPHWNPDKQSEIQTKDPARAELLAKQAGCKTVDDPFHPKDGGPREYSQY